MPHNRNLCRYLFPPIPFIPTPQRDITEQAESEGLAMSKANGNRIPKKGKRMVGKKKNVISRQSRQAG